MRGYYQNKESFFWTPKPNFLWFPVTEDTEVFKGVEIKSLQNTRCVEHMVGSANIHKIFCLAENNQLCDSFVAFEVFSETGRQRSS